MPEVRLIDANALIKDIAESIRLADDWGKEAHEKKDKHGVKCAIDTRRSLLAMISRAKEAPTIEAEPVRHGRWIRRETALDTECKCSVCGYKDFVPKHDNYWFRRKFCPNCGARMDATDTNVGGKGGEQE